MSVLQLNPETVQSDANRVRFGLKSFRVERLAESIREAGGVKTPVEVEQTEDGYRLISGHYRLAAVLRLNKEGAGLTLPALIRDAPKTEVERIKAQLNENVERENLSPMDEAIAICAMLDAGANKLEVRNAFARVGGRKGLTIAPASNAHINMVLSFLTLPKAVQEKIHDGRVGVGAAYQLMRVAPEKRAEVLERAEADRISAIDRDEKDEEKLLNSEKSVTTAAEKAEAAGKEQAEAAAKAKTATEQEEQAAEAAAAAYNAFKTEKDPAAKKEKEKAFKAAEKTHKEAESAAAKVAKDAEKLAEKAKAAAEYAEKKRKELEEKRKAKKAAGKVSASAVAKSAATTETGYVPLNMAQVRQLLEEMTDEKATPKIKAIGQAFQRAFKGELTTKQLIKTLTAI